MPLRPPVADVLAADVGFVSFNHPGQHGWIGLLHGRPDAVAEIPRGLVADSEHPLELVGRDPFLGLGHQVSGDEPLTERKVGVMKDRAGHRRELVAA